MSHRLRIGARIVSTDPFWVQVREEVHRKMQKIDGDLVPIDIGPSAQLSNKEYIDLVDELLAQDLDVLISTSLPEPLTYLILDSGLPIIFLTETDMRHPLLVSPRGYYDIGRMIGAHVIEQMQYGGHVLIVGGLRTECNEDGRSRLAALQDSFGEHPGFRISHIPSVWRYEEAYEQIYDGLQLLAEPIDVIIGLSDPQALAARDAARALGIFGSHTLLAGINGDPLALAAIAEGSMTATIETSASDFASQALELARRAAAGSPLPVHLYYKPRLITVQNVADVAMQKLIEIAPLPDRLVGVNHQRDQQQLTQLQASLEISHRIGCILEPQQLSSEIADIIRTSYDYNHVQLFHWLENEQVLVRDKDAGGTAEPLVISPGDASPLGEALRQKKPIFIADTRRSHRFPPDPAWPQTRSRVIVPIRLGERFLGLLDMHSHTATQRTRQELVGLQSLADQLGVAMRNAELFGDARQAQTTAEKANQLKTRLLANVSHELRTPLNLVIGYCERALANQNPYECDLPPALLHDLHCIEQNSSHLITVINDLLDLSRAEIDELHLSPELLAPRPFIEEVFESFANGNLADTRVAWRLDLPNDLPMIEADPVRLRQILLNLLSNACKFTTHGEITLGATVALPHLHLWVADTGSGIPTAQQESIFDPFVTGEQADRRAGGIGLGLSITRRLVALHRGSITVESEVGHGSTFHVHLPLPSLYGTFAPPPSETQPMLLLIAPVGQVPQAIYELSQHQGLTIRHLLPADNLEAVLARTQPSALAWDLSCAGRDDWEVIQQLRSHPKWCRLPFIVYNQPQEQLLQPAAGLTNILIKPLSGKTLGEALEGMRPAESDGPVLIVDDDPQVRALYQQLVKSHLPHHTVQTVAGGSAALAFLAHTTPSLVILDLMMPDVDGFAVLEQLRASKQSRHVPVLLISGRLLTFEDIERLDYEHVTLHSKDMLGSEETVLAVQRALSGSDRLARQTSTLVKRAVAYIQQHYNSNMSRQELAEAVGVSQNYLSQIFQRELNLSPWEYLNRYRIKRAKELLRSSTVSISTIATQVGFDDPAYFSRVFRKQVDCSPQSYRTHALSVAGRTL